MSRASWFISPYPITCSNSPTAVRLKLPATMRHMHPTFHVSRIKPSVTHPLCHALYMLCLLTPLMALRPLLLRNCWMFVKGGRGVQYSVDWEGYGPEERSWVLSRFILDPQLIREFKTSRPNPPSRTPRGICWGGAMWHSQNSVCICHAISTIIYHFLYNHIFIHVYISYCLASVHLISSCICVVIADWFLMLIVI